MPTLPQILTALGIFLALYIAGGIWYEWEIRKFFRSMGDEPQPLREGPVLRWLWFWDKD